MNTGLPTNKSYTQTPIEKSSGARKQKDNPTLLPQNCILYEIPDIHFTYENNT